MKIHIFTIPVIGGEAIEAELNSFLSMHRIVSLEKHFVDAGQQSYWTFCITWTEMREKLPGRKNRIDYKEELNERDFALYAKLRDLRKQLAENEGVPAYAIFTNEQLAEIARQKITTKTALAGIKGIGEARVEKYAEPFIACLKKFVEKDNRGNEE